METNDAAVVALVRSGDSEAFRVLVERHSRHMFRLAWRMTGNEQDAEDVVQETFLRAYKQLHRFDGRATFSTWIFRIAANYSHDLMRSRKRRQEQMAPADEDTPDPIMALASGDPLPDRIAMSTQVREMLGPALDALSPVERTAFVLRHYEGLGIDEIGRALGVQTSAAKQSVFRAVRKLRRALEPAVSSTR